MPDTVLFQTDGPVCTILLNRPDRRNAVDGPTAAALLRAFERLEADEALRVAVLGGAGGHFCAGADLTAMGDPARRNHLDPEGGQPGPMGPSRMALSKPLIAAVSGYAVAGGLELALLADVRVVERDAMFGVFCRRWGVPLIDGGTVRLPRVVGMGRALDMILTGRPVSADEALAMGLANRVVDPGARSLPPNSSRGISPPFRSSACWPTGHRYMRNGICRWPTHCGRRACAAYRSCLPKALRAPRALRVARAGMAEQSLRRECTRQNANRRRPVGVFSLPC